MDNSGYLKIEGCNGLCLEYKRYLMITISLIFLEITNLIAVIFLWML